MPNTLIPISELTVGDKVELESGETVRIRKIKKGWFSQPSKMLTYSNGEWSCLLCADKINVVRETVIE